MQPVSNYIQITQVADHEKLITEKKQLVTVKVKAVSTDIQVPFKEGSEIVIARGKQILTNGGLFIHADNIFLFK